MSGPASAPLPGSAPPGGRQPQYDAEPMIRLEGLEKAFGARQILRGINLEIFPGETVCLIGGSGTGKSVTLKHIMRLIDPDKGRVWLDGEDITDAHGDRLNRARSKLGVNFQFGALLNWMTIFENVALPLRENTNWKAAQIEERVMQKLELLSIPHARDLYPTQISGGMVKRAGLARAVVMEESLKVILYDEPTSGLDPISTALVDEMVNEMKARLGLTQVIVTHDMASAYRTANRIAVLCEGKVVQFGTPYEIQHSKVPYVRQFVHGLTAAESEAEEELEASDEHPMLMLMAESGRLLTESGRLPDSTRIGLLAESERLPETPELPAGLPATPPPGVEVLTIEETASGRLTLSASSAPEESSEEMAPLPVHSEDDVFDDSLDDQAPLPPAPLPSAPLPPTPPAKPADEPSSGPGETS